MPNEVYRGYVAGREPQPPPAAITSTFQSINNSLHALVEKQKDMSRARTGPSQGQPSIREYFKNYGEDAEKAKREKARVRKGQIEMAKKGIKTSAKIAAGVTLIVMAIGSLKRAIMNLFGKKTEGQRFEDILAGRDPDAPIEGSILDKIKRSAGAAAMGVAGLSLLPGGTKAIGGVAKLTKGAVGKLVGRSAPKVVGAAAKKGVAKVAGKTLLKSAVKKIPLVGLVVGAGLGIARMVRGDFAGAAMEVASGAASTIPGVGTAGSLAIDAGIAARDLSKEAKEGDTINENKIMNNMTTTFAQGGGPKPEAMPFPANEQEESIFRGMVRAISYVQQQQGAPPSLSQVHGYEEPR